MLFFNNDHQDILLLKIVFQIRDGIALVGECLSIKEKKETTFSRREGTFLRETLHSVRLEAWLLDHYWKRQILERQEFFPLENRGIVFILSSMTCTYFYEDFRAKSHLNNKPLFLRKGEVSSIYVVLKSKLIVC